MRLEISSGEAYPHLFVTFPDDMLYQSDGPDLYDVPDDLAAKVKTAREEMYAAEDALIKHLKDTGQAEWGHHGIERRQ